MNVLYDKDHYKLALGQINIAKNLIDKYEAYSSHFLLLLTLIIYVGQFGVVPLKCVLVAVFPKTMFD